MVTSRSTPPPPYLGAYVFVVVKQVERKLYKQQCPMCGLDAGPVDVSGKCPLCDARWKFVPTGEVIMAKPTISDLLPDCTTLDQAYPDGGDPGAIYLVAKSEDVQIAEKDWRWVTGVDVDHKIGLFKNVFEAELKRLNDHHAVWAWYVAFGLFRSEER